MSFKFKVGDLVTYVDGHSHLIGKTYQIIRQLRESFVSGNNLYRCKSEETGKLLEYYESRFELVKKKEKLQLELF